jgi:hypothetical protein
MVARSDPGDPWMPAASPAPRIPPPRAPTTDRAHALQLACEFVAVTHSVAPASQRCRHRIEALQPCGRKVDMNPHISKPLFAMLLAAAAKAQALAGPPGVGPAPAEAAPNAVGAEIGRGIEALADELVAKQASSARQYFRPLSGWDTGSVEPQLEAGPQYRVNDKLALGGEWHHFQPTHVEARPDIDRYAFGLRVLF